MYGLDLFSGIGGITKALEGYIQPIAYCENDRYCQGVLLSRMANGDIPNGPVWDDIRTFDGRPYRGVDIIYGGFPCQDISTANVHGKGLEGKRSGLFFEIVRLISEIRPRFVFLENVAAITVRGAERVVGELCRLGYDCRWGILSAQDVGANHRRERWWMLARRRSDVDDSESGKLWLDGEDNGKATRTLDAPASASPLLAYSKRIGSIWPQSENRKGRRALLQSQRSNVAHPDREHGERRGERSKSDGESGPARDQPQRGGNEMADPIGQGQRKRRSKQTGSTEFKQFADWWQSEPDVGRVANGIPMRVDRLRGLGNAVVPAQAREAFERLMGLK